MKRLKPSPRVKAKIKEVDKVVEKIKTLVKKGKVRWAGDISLYQPSQSSEEHKKKMTDPQFVKVAVDKIWGKWGRKDRRGNKGGLYINWGAKGVGFGEITFFMDFDGKLHCRSECMGRNFVKKALAAMVDQCVWDE